MKYFEGIDYWVKKVEFPNMASESVVVSNGDGTFVIFINTLFSQERQEDRLAHEIKHLEDEHFYRDDLEITQVERQADGLESPPPVQKKKQEPKPLPNVFKDHPKGTIPVFASLDAMCRYMLSMREQCRAQKKQST